jgi:hypothetical protein
VAFNKKIALKAVQLGADVIWLGHAGCRVGTARNKSSKMPLSNALWQCILEKEMANEGEL